MAAAVQGPAGRRRKPTCPSLTAPRHPPKAIVGEAVREVAKADLRSVFCSQSSETIGPPPRTDAASDSDDDKGVMGEAIPVVHAGSPYVPALVKPPCAPTFPYWLPDQFDRYAQIAAIRPTCGEPVTSAGPPGCDAGHRQMGDVKKIELSVRMTGVAPSSRRLAADRLPRCESFPTASRLCSSTPCKRRETQHVGRTEGPCQRYGRQGGLQ